jgi:hypothetical protein
MKQQTFGEMRNPNGWVKVRAVEAIFTKTLSLTYRYEAVKTQDVSFNIDVSVLTAWGFTQAPIEEGRLGRRP